MDIEFLQAVLPDNDGYFYVVRQPEPKLATDRPRHTACQVRNPSKAQWLQDKHGETNALFFTMFTFKTDYLPNDNGDPRNVRKRDDQKLECQVLWLDVDIGEGDGKYATKQDALTALLGISTDNPHIIPPTYLVDSGGGIHAYWRLENPLALPEWQAAADRFKQFWVDAGLLFDRGVTADSARYLRLPGTNNLKLDTPRPCKRLNYAGQTVPMGYIPLWPEPAVATVATSHIKPFHAATDERMGEGYAPKFTKEIVENCAVFKRIAETGGADCDEPLWRDVLQTVKLTEDADEWSHTMSSGHADYDHDAVEQKRHTLTHDKAILCTTYADHFPGEDICAGCPLKGKARSPLACGAAPKPEQVVIQHTQCQPDNVEIRAGGTYVKVEAKKEDEEPYAAKVSSSALIDVKAQTENLQGVNYTTLIITHDTAGKRWVEKLPMAELYGPKWMVYLDSARLALATPKHYAAMKEILMSWANNLRTAGMVAESNAKQGWVSEHGLTAFSHNGNLYLPDGTVEVSEAPVYQSEAAIAYTSAGDLATWTAAANDIMKNGNEKLVTMLASAFGAPLAILVAGQGGCASLSYYTTVSSNGKSTMLRTARSVWGVPDQHNMGGDTVAGLLASVDAAPNLPLMVDDVQQDQNRAGILKLIFDLSGMRSKTRATQTGGLNAGKPLHTFMVTTGNKPFSGETSSLTNAESMRFLEIDATADHPFSSGSQTMDDLKHNYGVAGGVYAKYLAANRDKVKARCLVRHEEVKEMLGSVQAERFYWNTVTICLVGAEVAKELGLVDFDIPALEERFTTLVTESRAAQAEEAQGMTPVQDVHRFLHDELVHGGVVKSFSHPREQDVPTPVPAQIEKWHYVKEDSTGTYRIATDAFLRWHKRRHGTELNMRGWFERAADIVQERSVQRSFAVGHRTFTGSKRVRCFVVRITDEINTESGDITLAPETADAPAAEG